MAKYPTADEGAFEERPSDPRRRHPEEDEYGGEDLPPPPRPLNWLDKQFSQTSLVVLVLFPLCCGIIALVFGIIGVAACEHPKARKNAIIVLVISIVWILIAVVFSFVNAILQQQAFP
jgi:hypothetical protein